LKRITVALGKRSYPICVGRGIRTQVAEIVFERVKPSSVALITHPNLAKLYGDDVVREIEKRGITAHVFIVPAGERHKTLTTVHGLYDRMLAAGLDRKSLIVTLGGGVLGDMGGFAAATFLRGIPYVQMPTTLLAQVDASIGGKTGVDLPQGKNLIGAFHQPSAVIIDTETLESLPLRELRSGLAEVIKYGIICDKSLFERLNSDMPLLLYRNSGSLFSAIVRSCEIKAAVVRADETEQGRRAILNFGHTVGHALESVTGYRQYKHGEAISIGMVSASLVGEKLGVCGKDVTSAIQGALRKAYLPVAFPPHVEIEQIIAAMARDKKTVGGEFTFVLAPQIGETILRRGVAADVVRVAIIEQRGIE
jgi:3-dehydroquinate synthase